MILNPQFPRTLAFMLFEEFIFLFSVRVRILNRSIIRYILTYRFLVLQMCRFFPVE